MSRTRRAVRLPLNLAVKRYLSSEEYNEALDLPLNYLDVIYTFFLRYPWILDELESVIGEKGKGAPIEYLACHPIASIALTLLFGVTAVVMIRSAYRSQDQAQKDKAGTYNKDFRRFKKSFRKHPAVLEQKSGEEASESEPDSDTDEPDVDEVNRHLLAQKEEDPAEKKARRRAYQNSLNDCLGQLLMEDKQLKKKKRQYDKYEKVIIVDGKVQFEFSEAEEPIIHGRLEKAKHRLKRGCALVIDKAVTTVYSSWVGVCIAAFVYWLLWIGMIALTGNVSAAGVDGLGMAGYAIPLGFGLVYPLIKIRNWYRNKFGYIKENKGKADELWLSRDPRLALEAAADISKLLKKAILMEEMKRLQKDLKIEVDTRDLFKVKDRTQLESDDRYAILGRGKWKKTGVIFLSTLISTYINVQYGAWWVTDFLKEAAGMAFDSASLVSGLGIVFIGCSVAYAIYKAVKRYREVKKYKAKLEKQEIEFNNEVASLESTCARKQAIIEGLKSELESSMVDGLDRLWLKQQSRRIKSANVVPSSQIVKPSSQVTTIAMAVLVFFAGATSGIMMGRVATIAATLTFVPFAAASLSNPVTIGILVACGVVFGLFKVYEYYQKKKEAEAKRLFEERQEKLELLTGQCKLADLQIRLLEEKKKQLTDKPAPASLRPEPSSSFQLTENAVYSGDTRFPLRVQVMPDEFKNHKVRLGARRVEALQPFSLFSQSSLKTSQLSRVAGSGYRSAKEPTLFQKNAANDRVHTSNLGVKERSLSNEATTQAHQAPTLTKVSVQE